MDPEHMQHASELWHKAVAKATQTKAKRVAPQPARVIADFEAQGSEDITVRKGETVTITRQSEHRDWYIGKVGKGREGRFPAHVVELSATARARILSA